MNKNILTGIVVVAVAGVSFWGGMTYAKSKTPTPGNFVGANAAGGMGGQFRNGQGGQAGGARGGMMGGAVTGEVISKDDKSVTVKLRDGGSKIVFFSASTQVSKMASGVMEDVKVGEQITVTGTTNSDGSVIGTTIQLRPAFTSSTAGMMLQNGGNAPAQK